MNRRRMAGATMWAAVVACNGASTVTRGDEAGSMDAGRSAEATSDDRDAEQLDAADASGALASQPPDSAGDASPLELVACNPPPAPFPSHPCPPSLCGNGRRDTNCMTDAGPNGQEPCDGADLGGMTCATLNYFGGSLACNAQCDFDLAGCESCIPNTRVSACVHPHAAAPPSSLALAATDSEIAVAWVEAASYPTAGVHFTRLGLDFTLLSDTPCIGPVQQVYGRELSLASVGAGWLLAVSDPNTVTLLQLDAQGVLGRSQSLWAPGAGCFGGGRLTPRAGAGPLLTWLDCTQATLHVQQLNADGSAAGNDITIANVDNVAATSVDDGFALAAYVNPSYDVQLFHLALDGTLRSGASIPEQPHGNLPKPIALAWTGSDLRLLYEVDVIPSTGLTQAVLWQLATRDGALVGGPVTISTGGPEVVRLLPSGTDTVALRRDFGLGTLSVLRLTASGMPAWPELTVMRAGYFLSPDIALQGGDAIVGWIDNPRLSFERVRITP
jgi:hypothetical protein